MSPYTTGSSARVKYGARSNTIAGETVDAATRQMATLFEPQVAPPVSHQAAPPPPAVVGVTYKSGRHGVSAGSERLSSALVVRPETRLAVRPEARLAVRPEARLEVAADSRPAAPQQAPPAGGPVPTAAVLGAKPEPPQATAGRGAKPEPPQGAKAAPDRGSAGERAQCAEASHSDDAGASQRQEQFV